MLQLGYNPTWGDVMFGLFMVIVFDMVMTWVFADTFTDFWYKRAQWPLKVGVYAATIAFAILVMVTPWPYNLLLAVLTFLAFVCLRYWFRNRNYGRLAIIVVGLTSAIGANILVVGAGKTHQVHWSKNLSLKAGTYAIKAGESMGPDGKKYLPDVTDVTVTITPRGVVSQTVTYHLIP